MTTADVASTPILTARHDDTILTLTMRRASVGNALDPGLVEALLRALADAARLPGLRLIVLRGEGRAFCTGLDLAGIESQSDADLLLRVVRIELLLQAVRHAPVPVLALAHGHAMGAGADLFAASQWRVAAPGTRFAFPGARFGLVLGTRRLAAIVKPQDVIDLTVRSRRIDAEQALAMGLATGVVDPEAWDDVVAAMASEVASGAMAEAQPVLRHAALPDTRDADLADLVRSAAGTAGLKDRILAYAAAASAARRPASATGMNGAAAGTPAPIGVAS